MGDPARRVTGGCLCGAVRYEAEVFLQSAHYCHCKDCQRSSGQPAEIAVPVKVGTLRFTKGKPKYYSSSPWAQRGFCADCGSRIVWQPRDPQEAWSTNINVGSLDNPEDARPSMHIFVDRQLPWYKLDDNLPRARSDEMEPVVAAWKQELLGSS
jgi:adenylate cyclase